MKVIVKMEVELGNDAMQTTTQAIEEMVDVLAKLAEYTEFVGDLPCDTSKNIFDLNGNKVGEAHIIVSENVEVKDI